VFGSGLTSELRVKVSVSVNVRLLIKHRVELCIRRGEQKYPQ